MALSCCDMLEGRLLCDFIARYIHIVYRLSFVCNVAIHGFLIRPRPPSPSINSFRNPVGVWYKQNLCLAVDSGCYVYKFVAAFHHSMEFCFDESLLPEFPNNPTKTT